MPSSNVSVTIALPTAKVPCTSGGSVRLGMNQPERAL